MDLVECVPNFSEGRRPEVVAAIRDAIAAVPGVSVLDVSSDPSHNRTVVTFVAPPDAAVDAAFAGIATARDLIDLTAHEGEHPRIGATDVCPFIPVAGVTMDDCVALAERLGARVGDELGIPVFLYERAARRPERANLADVRRGEFEQARADIGTNPDRDPDFGPRAIHPTAGATVIGARPFLVAYNVYLGGAEHLQVAKDVAKAVRASSGGLPYVKALGLEVDGEAQVSMNLVDTDATPLSLVFDTVRAEAEARGVSPTRSELVGLVPEKVLFETAAHHVLLPDFTPDMVLETQVRAAVAASAAPTARPVPRERRGSRSRAWRRQRQRARGPARRGAGRDGRRPDDRSAEVRRRRGRDDRARGRGARAARPPRRARPGGRRRLRRREQRLPAAEGRRPGRACGRDPGRTGGRRRGAARDRSAVPRRRAAGGRVRVARQRATP